MSISYHRDAVVLISFLFCGSIFFDGLAKAEDDPSFCLDPDRSGENAITLTCTDCAGNAPDPDPQFFRNRTVPVDGIRGAGNKLTFVITREEEGDYTCGSLRVQSNSVTLIALPTSDVPMPLPSTTYALVQQPPEEVQLHCAIDPGMLIQQYFVTWYKSDDVIYKISSNGYITTNSERYSHNPSNLALVISDVEMDDTSNNYHCVLEVVDPLSPGGENPSYNVLKTIDIPLRVLANPEIIVAPQTYTTIEGENVLFRCVAQGYPAPAISWRHKNVTLSSEDNPAADYIITGSSRQDGNLMITDSELRILSVKAGMSGEVECFATASPPMDSGRTLTSTQAPPASLIVFGNKFASIDVEITRQLDALFAVDLEVAYRQEVRLVLVYTNVDDPTEAPYNKTSSMPYANRTMIRHIEFASQIPFEHFQVQVGLTFDGVDGPLINVPGRYDKNQPTLCERRIETRLHIVIGVLAALLPVMILAIILAYNGRKVLHRRLKSIVNKHGQKVITSINENTNEKLAGLEERLKRCLDDYEKHEMKFTNKLKESDKECAA